MPRSSSRPKESVPRCNSTRSGLDYRIQTLSRSAHGAFSAVLKSRPAANGRWAAFLCSCDAVRCRPATGANEIRTVGPTYGSDRMRRGFGGAGLMSRRVKRVRWPSYRQVQSSRRDQTLGTSTVISTMRSSPIVARCRIKSGPRRFHFLCRSAHARHARPSRRSWRKGDFRWRASTW
jgi:hypothetical protein